jgi:hypothetical protein
MTQEFIDKLIERISDKVAEKVVGYLIKQDWFQTPKKKSIYPFDNVAVMYGVELGPYTEFKTTTITNNSNKK